MEKQYEVKMTVTMLDGESAEDAEQIIMESLSEAEIQVDCIIVR